MSSEIGDTEKGAELLRGKAKVDQEYTRALLAKLDALRRNAIWAWASAIGLLLAALAVMLWSNKAVLIWLMVAFVLYCFNFFIWFLPTTRKGAVMVKADPSGERTYKETIRNMWKRKKMLGTEVLLTTFLAGMVPLALSFLVIFGVGTLFALYYVWVLPTYTAEDAYSFLAQVAAILAFFLVLVLLRPQERGFAKAARAIKKEVGKARSANRVILVAVIAAVAVLLAVLGVLFIAALLMPGGTLNAIISFIQEEGGLNVLLLLFALLVEFAVMRHLQAYASRRQARRLLERRSQVLDEQVIAPMSAPSAGKKELDEASSVYYNLALYKVYEHNFYGYWPVFVVGPNVRVLVDERSFEFL